MTARSCLFAAAFVSCVLLIGLEARGRGETGSSHQTSARNTGYAGSEACRACHRTAYEQWQRSIHVRMTQPIEGAAVLGDFSAQPSPGATSVYSVGRQAHGPVMTTDAGSGRETHELHYTLGEKRLQGYMSRLPDGRIYVLPLFWHNEWRRWIDWSEITPINEDSHRTTGVVERRQIWNRNCFNCHATNIQRNYDVATRAFATTWTEMGVGCEACHGPGREHIVRLKVWGDDPSRHPEIDIARPGADLSAQLAIFVPRSSTTRQVYDSCAYCHGNKTNYFVGFQPGDRLEDYAQLALLSDPIPASDPQGDYWPDGRPSRFNRPQALTMAGCFARGAATCTTCHAAHGSTERALPQSAARPRRFTLHPVSRVHRPTRALSSCAGVGRQQLHRLSYERRQLAVADTSPRSHVRAAGAGADGQVRRAERVHDVSRRSHARMGRAGDGRLVRQRRRASQHRCDR